jgi:hypothetical protein
MPQNPPEQILIPAAQRPPGAHPFDPLSTTVIHSTDHKAVLCLDPCAFKMTTRSKYVAICWHQPHPLRHARDDILSNLRRGLSLSRSRLPYRLARLKHLANSDTIAGHKLVDSNSAAIRVEICLHHPQQAVLTNGCLGETGSSARHLFDDVFFFAPNGITNPDVAPTIIPFASPRHVSLHHVSSFSRCSDLPGPRTASGVQLLMFPLFRRSPRGV